LDHGGIQGGVYPEFILKLENYFHHKNKNDGDNKSIGTRKGKIAESHDPNVPKGNDPPRSSLDAVGIQGARAES
jgi:hypothetical protein